MRSSLCRFILAAAFIVTTAVYWPGLSGSFLFDDYPNIVDNHDVQPHAANLPSLVRVALSSPSSEFKRPLASLSFAANYLATGLDPYWMKLTNLAIHLLNGLLVFLLARALLQSVPRGIPMAAETASDTIKGEASAVQTIAAKGIATEADIFARTGVVAALIAAGWMLLPINVTGVLYVVQRMESMANLFVLLGLIGYVAGRRRMLAYPLDGTTIPAHARRGGLDWRLSPDTRGLITCVISITVPAAFGILAKETAVMLPLYALLIEWALFRFSTQVSRNLPRGRVKKDPRVITLFVIVLALPIVMGLAWLLPGLLNPGAWATRDFTLGTRLLSESRIVCDYIAWTLIPTPDALSFYHDDFRISTGLLSPWTTLSSIAFLTALVALILWLRSRKPLVALGIALFLGCQLLTGTILPLELIYEHRNYFASFGLLLALIPLLAVTDGDRSGAPVRTTSVVARISSENSMPIVAERATTRTYPNLVLPCRVLLGGLLLLWGAITLMTALAWGNPMRLAQELAARAPESPRAQYELGRTYIIYSHYDPSSPFIRLAYVSLEKAASLKGSSILPEQALIFMNARMHLPLKNAWWNSLIFKLKAHDPSVQDESSLSSLTQCARENDCKLPADRMTEAFLAALAHPAPSARLLATYGDYAWNMLDDKALGERMTEKAVRAAPNEPAYQITLIRMLAAEGRNSEAIDALKQLETLNIGGRLNGSLAELRALPGLQ